MSSLHILPVLTHARDVHVASPTDFRSAHSATSRIAGLSHDVCDCTRQLPTHHWHGRKQMLSVVADPSMARQKWREPEHLQHPLPETMDSPLRRLSGADSSRKEDTSLAMIARRRASTADKTGKKKNKPGISPNVTWVTPATFIQSLNAVAELHKINLFKMKSCPTL